MSDPATAATEQSFWASLITGIVMILAGVGIWLNPEWFMPLVGVVVLLEGIRLAWQGLFARQGDGNDGLRVLLGVLAIFVGAGIWASPDKAAPIVLYMVTGWLLVYGLFIAFARRPSSLARAVASRRFLTSNFR
jgi:uncharacterized membrane protein HdeD (DUF308 family)